MFQPCLSLVPSPRQICLTSELWFLLCSQDLAVLKLMSLQVLCFDLRLLWTPSWASRTGARSRLRRRLHLLVARICQFVLHLLAVQLEFVRRDKIVRNLLRGCQRRVYLKDTAELFWLSKNQYLNYPEPPREGESVRFYLANLFAISEVVGVKVLCLNADSTMKLLRYENFLTTAVTASHLLVTNFQCQSHCLPDSIIENFECRVFFMESDLITLSSEEFSVTKLIEL